MAVFTVSLQQAAGVGDISLGDGTTLATLSVSAGRGPKGDGFTGGTYNASTGIVTFTSNDGIGFSTGDLRGDLSEPGPIGDVTPNTGAFTSLSTTGGAVIGGDLTVEGTTTTVDSTTVAVGDKNIELAKDATTPGEADGGGITLTGASATITYSSANDYWALNKGLNVSGNVSLSGTVDGRDVAADGSKLDGIESNADVTDTANVTAAGALMDSEVTNLSQVKAFDSSDYATAAQGSLADSALQDGDTVASLDINGGTIDGTVIGGSTPAAISGTTGQFGTSLNVDGTVTADGLDIATGINTSGIVINTPYGIAGEQYAAIRWNNTSFAGGDSEIRNVVDGTSSVGSSLEFFTEQTGTGVLTERLKLHNNGDISFYEDTGTTPKFFWDASAERLGIGTSSPASVLHVQASGAGASSVRIANTSAPGSDFSLSAGIPGLGNSGFSIYDNSGASTRLHIDSSGNVGIGTSSPVGAVHVANSDTFNNIPFRIENTGGSNSFDIRVGTSATLLETNGAQHLVFATNNTERMRIDSGGNLLVGTTVAAGNKTHIAFDPASQNGMRFSHSSGTYTNSAIVFVNAVGSTVGSIKTNGTTTSYNTSSDERLKENIADAQPASDLIDGIQVRKFDWKADGEHQRYGMVAQELETVAPEAVTKGETEDDMWSVDYSKLVPMLIKEIQDLRKRVAELEATA